jgi:hypothetical protein
VSALPGRHTSAEQGSYNFLFSLRLGGSAGRFVWGGRTAHSRLKLGSPRRGDPTLFFRFAWIRVIRGLFPNGKGLPFLQRIFFVASCLRVSSWLTRISARRGRIPSIPKIPSSASRRLCGRIWVGGRTAHSRLKLGSPRRGDPTHFSIRAHLLAFASCPQTEEDCRCYNRTDFLRGASSICRFNPGNRPSGRSRGRRRFRG